MNYGRSLNYERFSHARILNISSKRNLRILPLNTCFFEILRIETVTEKYGFVSMPCLRLEQTGYAGKMLCCKKSVSNHVLQ